MKDEPSESAVQRRKSHRNGRRQANTRVECPRAGFSAECCLLCWLPYMVLWCRVCVSLPPSQRFSGGLDNGYTGSVDEAESFVLVGSSMGSATFSV